VVPSDRRLQSPFLQHACQDRKCSDAHGDAEKEHKWHAADAVGAKRMRSECASNAAMAKKENAIPLASTAVLRCL